MIRKSKMGAAAAFAVTVGLLAAGSAHAGIVFGGTGKSDCYAAISVEGIDAGSARVEKNRKVLCTDGEACDTGACGDGVCNLRVAACINQPGLAQCTPPAGLKKFKVKGKLNVGVPRLLRGSACGDFLNVTIATKKGGKKPGKAKLAVQAQADKGTKPASDSDNFELQCLPRTVACPPPTTTSTTTTSSSTILVTTTVTSSTTTTTLPRKCLGDAPNGTLEQDEECDDGNTVNGDGCDRNCTFTACGNGEISEPETCDDGNLADEDFCPTDCRVDFCQPTTQEIVATVQLSNPNVAALTVFVDYPEGRVEFQGVGGNIPPGILVGPGTVTTTGNDFDHALRIVAFDAFNFDTTTMATIKFNGCEGVAPPQAQDFSCRLEGNATDDSFMVVPGVTCSVVVQ